MAGGEVAKQLIGAWRYAGTRVNGEKFDRGANPKGMIYYGPTAKCPFRSRPMSNADVPER
jgi:hypothetical protein